MFHKTYLQRIAAAFGVAFCLSNPALSQGALPDFYKEPGIYPNRDYLNQTPTEHIDPFTGALQLHQVDIQLPGNGGFDLQAVRSYNSTSIDPLLPAGTISNAGMGWTIHFGRILKGGYSVCSNSNGVANPENPVLELPDGSRQLFAFTDSGSPLMKTGQQWIANCLGAGTGLSVYSPNGTRYDMTQLVSDTSGSYVWYVTKITDRNGNTATINYAAAYSSQITSVSTSDGRSLSFSYLDASLLTRRISSISSNAGQTWNYSYTEIPNVPARYFLTRVTRPDGQDWKYEYNASLGNNAGSYLLNKMTQPESGYTTYIYGYVYFDLTSNPSTRSTVVAAKSASDGGNWSFSYNPGNLNQYDRTVVNTPSGSITYKHIGPNYASSGMVWAIGLLVEKTLGSLQTETYQWDKIFIASENNFRPGAFALKVDTDTYAPVLTRKTLVRNGATYQTTYSNYDNYGNPGTVVESGPNSGNRTTTYTYNINTSKWLVKQVSGENTSGVGSVSRTWDSNGNLLSENRDGVTTSMSYHSTGDIYQLTKPRSLTSTYTNYKRGIPQNETHPEGVSISRQVSDAGNVTSETNGESRTTSYNYDGLNRLTGIRPPSGNSTSKDLCTTLHS